MKGGHPETESLTSSNNFCSWDGGSNSEISKSGGSSRNSEKLTKTGKFCNGGGQYGNSELRQIWNFLNEGGSPELGERGSMLKP